jgi:hypothetical protein
VLILFGAETDSCDSNLILNAVLPLFWQLFNNNFIDKSVDIPMIPSHLGDDRRLRHVIVLHLAHSNKIQKIWRPHHRAAQGRPPR